MRGKPCETIKPLTATLVEVPIKVQVPPKMDANYKGIKILDGAMPDSLDNPMVGFNFSAVMVVLFIKPEVNEATSITKNTMIFGGCFLMFTKRAIKVSITPVCLSAPTITNMEARMMIKFPVNDGVRAR